MVAFGETLLQQQVPAHRLHYVDYEGLKQLLNESAAGEELGSLLQQNQYAAELKPPAGSHPKAAGFLAALEREITKVNEFVVSRMARVTSQLDTLRQQVRQPGAQVARLDEEAGAIEAELIEVDRFIRLNLIGFRKITKKFDKVKSERAGVWLSARLAREPFCQVELEAVVSSLAALRGAIRALDGKVGGAKGGDVRDPGLRKVEFKRSTTKYWVRNEDELEVMLRIMRHLPVSTHALAAKDTGKGAPPIAQWVSSVYFDSDAFESYHTRLSLAEGAELYRVRFYGSLDPMEAPCLFVERKTHHDKQASGQSSVKARMPLAAEHASPFFAGRQMDLESLCMESAYRKELPATEAAAAAVLGGEWQRAISEKRMKPVIRTVFRRVAFNSIGGASMIRITFDTQMNLFREPKAAEGCVPTPGGAWCAQLSDSVDARAAMRPFPHAILEIKLGDADSKPPWLIELLESGLVQAVPKFSKFLTATAAHYQSSLNAIPDYFAQPSLAAFVANQLEAPAASPRAAATLGTSGGGGALGTASSTISSSRASAATNGGGGDGGSFRSRASGNKVWPPWGRQSARASAPASASRVKLVDRTSIGGRADPKTFFANERTFIQWLSAGMLLLSVGIALIEFRAAQLRSERNAFILAGSYEVDPVTGASLEPAGSSVAAKVEDFLAGILVCSMALVIIAYGLSVFLWRLKKLQRRDSSGYADPYGPPIVATATFVAVLIYITVHVRGTLDDTNTNAFRDGASAPNSNNFGPAD